METDGYGARGDEELYFKNVPFVTVAATNSQGRDSGCLKEYIISSQKKEKKVIGTTEYNFIVKSFSFLLPSVWYYSSYTYET